METIKSIEKLDDNHLKIVKTQEFEGIVEKKRLLEDKKRIDDLLKEFDK